MKKPKVDPVCPGCTEAEGRTRRHEPPFCRTKKEIFADTSGEGLEPKGVFVWGTRTDPYVQQTPKEGWR